MWHVNNWVHSNNCVKGHKQVSLLGETCWGSITGAIENRLSIEAISAAQTTLTSGEKKPRVGLMSDDLWHFTDEVSLKINERSLLASLRDNAGFSFMCSPEAS